MKTVHFSNPKYVGDPLNAVRIFNEKLVDELIVLDIDATRDGRPPNYELIAQLASECNMPLCYGGGVSNADQIQRLVALGVEKVAIGAGAVERPGLVRESAEIVGSQSVVVVLDVAAKGLLKRPAVLIRNGKKKVSGSPVEMARGFERDGAGELLINSIDRDGTMMGYDLTLADEIMAAVSIPVTCLGGAGQLEHVRALTVAVGLVGAAAGSMFVFKGKYRAVLINYPNLEEKKHLFDEFELSKQ